MKINGAAGNGHPQRKNYALNFSDFIERGDWTGPGRGPDAVERYQYIARNKLRRDRYLHFAKMLVEWQRHFRSLGIELYGISPQNEPAFSHWFESCVFTPDEYSELVNTIGSVFAREGERFALFGPEHMTWDLAGNGAYLTALRDRHALTRLAAVASHRYVDGYVADRRSNAPAAFGRLAGLAGKRAWITEGAFGGHEWPVPLHEFAMPFIYALRDSEVSLVTTWQAVGRHQDEYALMSLGGRTKKTYAAMHFWRFIRAGAVRVSADVNGPVDAIAFHGPEPSYLVVILLNRNKASCTVSLSSANAQAVHIKKAYVTDANNACRERVDWTGLQRVDLPGESIATAILN